MLVWAFVVYEYGTQFSNPTLRTDVSRLPDQDCGPVFQLVLGKLSSAVNSLSGC